MKILLAVAAAALAAQSTANTPPPCKSSNGATCYSYDLSLFQRHCRSGDKCIGRSGVHNQCPVPANMTYEPFLSCLYKPTGIAPSTPVEEGYSAVLQYMETVSGNGTWNCSTNTWQPSGLRAVEVTPPTEFRRSFPSDFAIVTFGDSMSNNIYTGLSMIADEGAITKWIHDRHDISLNSTSLAISHICCSHCACGHSVEKAADLVTTAIRGSNAKRALIIMRPSLHAGNNVNRVLDETTFLFSSLRRMQDQSKNITFYFLWISLSGPGRLKPSKFSATQGEHPLRLFDSSVHAAVAEKYKLFNFTLSPPLMRIDVNNIFRGAERTASNDACEGAYESPDGTHMSLTLQYAVAQQIYAIIRKLPAADALALLLVRRGAEIDVATLQLAEQKGFGPALVAERRKYLAWMRRKAFLAVLSESGYLRANHNQQLQPLPLGEDTLVAKVLRVAHRDIASYI